MNLTVLLIAPLLTQATQTITSGDTTIARTTGAVAPSAIRKLTVVWQAGAGDDPSTSFATLTSIAVSPNGSVVTWDSKTPALRLYDSSGTLKRSIGRTGAGPGEYNRINGIAFRPDGRLLVWDMGNARINVYAPNGDTETSWRLPVSGFGTSNALTLDAQSRAWLRMNIWAPNGTAHAAWLRLGPTGKVIDTVPAPDPPGSDPALIARNGGATSNYSIPYGRSSVVALGASGEFLWGPGHQYVINTHFRGKPLRIEREYVAIPISAEERSEARASTEYGLRMTQPDWTWSGPDIPNVKPPYTGLSTGLDGRIWASLNVESERFTPPSPLAGRGPRPPPVTFRPVERRWDVFDPNGRYLGRIACPSTVRPMVMSGDYVWGASLNADDVPVLVKLRITPRF